MQGKPKLANLPRDVRAVLEGFYNGSLPAGQLSEALSRAWAGERRSLASSPPPLAAEQYVAAH